MSPSSSLPLLYFGIAHVSLALACAPRVVWPGTPGPFFFHPKMVALVHLLTLGWLAGSILGAFYIVAPLALRMPMVVGRVDWVVAAGFAAGLAGMVVKAWAARYDAFVVYALPVALACFWVSIRAWRGLRVAVVPWPIKLHVALAFLNLIAAIIYGAVIGWDRARGTLNASPVHSGTIACRSGAGLNGVAQAPVESGRLADKAEASRSQESAQEELLKGAMREAHSSRVTAGAARLSSVRTRTRANPPHRARP
jgi:hypothetical protein